MKKVFFSFALLGFIATTSCSSEIDCFCESKPIEGFEGLSVDFDFETEEDDCYEGLAERLKKDAEGEEADLIDGDAVRLAYDCEEK